MLRVRAWKDRSSPFVCAFCQHRLPRLSPSTGLRQLPAWNSQPPSTSALLHNSSNSSSPKPGVFPGAFARAGQGAWGSFAANANPPPGSSTATDGLLPHEREARQKSAGVDIPQPLNISPPNSTQPNQRRKTGELRDDKQKRRPNDAQVTKSRSVLADVFSANREPRPPPTPTSWSSATQDHGDTPPAGRFGSSGATQDSKSANHSLGWGGSSKKAANIPESSRSSTGGKTRATGWGSFSHRKSETTTTTHGVAKHGNESTIWSEITKGRRSRVKPSLGVGGKLHHGEPSGMTNQSPENDNVTIQDFWGELETRATSFKAKMKNKRESADGKPSKDKDSTQNQDEISNDLAIPAWHVKSDGEAQKPRRKSRFEIEEEQNDMRDRNSKKPKKAQKSRRAVESEDWDDEALHRWEQKQSRKAEKEARKKMALEAEKAAVPIFLPEYINVSNLGRALKQRSGSFLKDMEEMGFENVTSDTIFTGETAALVAMEYGFDPTVDSGSLRDLRPRPVPEDTSSLPSRPPVVTIMGHVDHGKTTLLDWLRKSSIAAQEHGGITQHIGAFVVNMSTGKSITFLDTPGHAAFLSMRQRGANVTDIVVLVVAADDSVMPQTIEALKHATTAKVPIIVAINKIDKEDAKVDQVKADLSRHGVEIEDYGGDVQVVGVSGKTGQGMADLEENILTLSEILDVRAENDGMAEGWILESSVKQEGKAATVLVKRGTLRQGDFIVAGKTWARIRVLRNEAGVDLAEAPPGTPVEILGWRELPAAGEQVLQSPDESKAKTAVEYRQEMSDREESSIRLAEQEQQQREKAAADAEAAEDGADKSTEPVEPKIITQNFTVKADVVGSVEAVCGSILELGNNEVRAKILRSSAGPISEYDIDHAATSKSVIVNFNCTIQPHIKQRAEEAKVKILDHTVIYHVVDDVKATLSDLLPMNITYRVNGEAEILQVFPINVKRRVYKNIAGCRVRNGAIKKSSLVKILRRGEVIYDGKIDTLKHVKKDVQEMGKGTECGIGMENFQDFKVDDQIQTYEEVKEKRHL